MFDEDYFDWWLRRHMYRHLNAPCMPVIELPPLDFEVKKMRFEKEFVGTGNNNEKLYRVKDCKNEIPFKRVMLSEGYIGDIVEWLNENVPDKPCKSFNEAVWDAIDFLWYEEQIEVTEWNDEFVVHEIKSTCIWDGNIKSRLIEYDVDVNSYNIGTGRNVFVIKEKNDGI